ncbi:MAG TPA: heme-binding domain-containing protein [Thermoanaerobaculia bacterium]|jgi:hypothetical protein
MKKWLKRIAVVLAVMFVAAQFVRPDMTNPPVDPKVEYRAPAHIQPILDRSCNDCHSNRTRWPWYSQITPVSWWLKDHIDEGRHELSFSEFGTYSPKKAAHKMEEVCEVVKKGEMPLREYVWGHPSARLSEADKHALCEWAGLEERRIKQTR